MGRTLNNIKRRQLARRQIVVLAAGFGAVIMVVLLVFAFTPSSAREQLGNIHQQAIAQEESQAVEVAGSLTDAEAPSLSLGLGGDVCFGLEVANIIKKEGPAYPWTEIAPTIQDYDLSVVNLEGPLCVGGDPNPSQPSSRVKGEPSCIPPMTEAGVDAVAMANDHMMDYGALGLQETLSLLRSQHIEAFGAGASRRLAEQPLVLESQDGARLALLSVSDVAPPSFTAGETSAGICAVDRDRIGGMIEQARSLAPYVVVFFHWGTAASKEITPRQKELAHASVEAGANLVVGCHPHVVQGLEMWQGVPIIYSLGNMVYYSQSEEGRSGLFAGCHFDGGRLASLEIIPLLIDRSRPARLAGEQAERVLQQVIASSPGVELQIDSRTGTGYLDLQ